MSCVVRVEVFYSARCPHCRAARSVVKRVMKRFRKRLEKQLGRRFEKRLGWSLEVEEVNTSIRSGAVRAEKYGIRAVPTIVVNGKKKIVGVPREKELRELIEKEMKID